MARLDAHNAHFMRLNTLLAVFYSMFANVHRDKDKRPQPYKVSDFLMDGEEKIGSVVMTPEDMIEVAKAWKAVYG